MNLSPITLGVKLALLALCLATHESAPIAIHVFFAPGPDCREATVAAIKSARKSIDGQYYNFTEPSVCEALIDAEKRGVTVRLIQDRLASQEKGNQLQACADAGIECYTDANHRIAHNKVLVIDGKHVVTGSWNASGNAQHNAENLLVIDDPEIAKLYAANWEKHRAEAKTVRVK